MKRRFFELLFLGAAATILPVHALSDTGSSPAKPSVRKAAAKPAKTTNDEGPAPAMTGYSGTDFHCELGNRLTIYESDSEKDRIAVRWNKQMYDLSRVQTTTGANRFENQQSGLVWISIPSKGMLLDSKKGQQLANECRTRSATQEKKSRT